MNFFFTKNPKKNFFWDLRVSGGRGRCRVGGGRVGRWMDSRTGPNQFAPSTSLKSGDITMHKCTGYVPDKLIFFTILSFDLQV